MPSETSGASFDSTRAHRVVARAHRLRSTQLQAATKEAGERARAPRHTRIVVATAAEISRDMHDQIFELLEENMRGMYEQVGGWDAPFKRAELQHPKSRYILAIHMEDDGSTASPSRSPCLQRRSSRLQSHSSPTLQGFIMWRYDTDETVPHDPYAIDGEECVEVAYWYVPHTRHSLTHTPTQLRSASCPRMAWPAHRIVLAHDARALCLARTHAQDHAHCLPRQRARTCLLYRTWVHRRCDIAISHACLVFKQ